MKYASRSRFLTLRLPEWLKIAWGSDLECLPLALLPQNSLGFRLRVSHSQTFVQNDSQRGLGQAKNTRKTNMCVVLHFVCVISWCFTMVLSIWLGGSAAGKGDKGIG